MDNILTDISEYSNIPLENKLEEKGAYSNVDFERGIIFLNEGGLRSFKQKIRNIEFGVTKLMNHGSGGTFVYLFLENRHVEKFTKFRERISGEGWNNEKGKFRISTKYVRIVNMPNHYSSSKNKCYFRNIFFHKISD